MPSDLRKKIAGLPVKAQERHKKRVKKIRTIVKAGQEDFNASKT